MRYAHITLAALALALAAPGCTLLINGNQYVGSGVDAGPMPDTGVPNDAAMDMGPHVNSLPIVSTVGLDQYRPMVGDMVSAITGTVYDADGDPTTLSYQWYINGNPKPGETAAMFNTSVVAANDVIHVEVWANDGMGDGPHVPTAEVTVLANQTRWRQLLPDEASDPPLMIWDAPNQRAVRIADGGAWEYAIEGAQMRVSRLPTGGVAPPSDDALLLVLDEGRRRLIVATYSDPANLFTLDIAHRGGATWMHTPVSGTSPDTFFFSTTFYDAATHRIFVIGGNDDTLGAIYGLTSLDVTTAGAESWHTITPSGATLPRMFGATVVADPSVAGRYYMIGGVTSTIGDGVTDPTYTMLDHVFQIDVSATDVHLTMLPGTEPPTFGCVAAANPATGHILVYGGVTTFGPGASIASPQIFDPATGTFTPLGGAPPHGAFLGGMAADPTAPGHFGAFTRSTMFDADSAALLQYDDVSETGVTQLLSRGGPLVLNDGAARFNDGAVEIAGGVGHDGIPLGSWSLDMRTLRWSALATTPDSSTTHSPDLRYGVRSDPTPTGTTQHLFQIGGARASGNLDDMVGFDLDVNDQWIEHTATGATLTPRVGAIAVAGDTCGPTSILVYGGEDVNGVPLGDGAALNCTAPHTCNWSSVGTVDTGRSYPAVFTLNGGAYVFGGRTSTGASTTLFGISTCSGAAPTSFAVTTTGAIPIARYGHSLTYMTGVTAATQFGVLFGGTDGTMTFGDVYTLTVATSGTDATWTGIVPADLERPAPRAYHMAVPDLGARRVIVVAGIVDRGFGNGDSIDVWELVFRP